MCRSLVVLPDCYSLQKINQKMKRKVSAKTQLKTFA
jgi:hypothetical protein